MGFNTCIVICNDNFESIETDPNFGKKLVEAATRHYRLSPANATYFDKVSVVSNQHADDPVYIKVGGNTGRVSCDLASELEFAEDMISTYRTDDPSMKSRLLAVKNRIVKHTVKT